MHYPETDGTVSAKSASLQREGQCTEQMKGVGGLFRVASRRPPPPQTMAKLHVKWVKSAIGYSERQKRTIQALGLHRLQQVVVHEDTEGIRGMLVKVAHLVQVEESES